MDTLERFLRLAKNTNTMVMLNPGIRELEQGEHLTKLLKYVDILNVNKEEASKIVPGIILSELLYHLRSYVGTAIITDGPMGGIAANGTETYRFGIYGDVKVKDATGAGDAFGSGFLAAIASGKSFRQALIFAAANSTSVVSKLGANKGILTGREKLHPMPIQEVK